MDTIITTGTTPEILQHYLTAGIEVKTPDCTGLLRGVLKNHISGRFIAQVMIGNTWTATR